MLVLSRKPGETIVVGGPCVITLVRSFAGRVKIGVTAEEGVPIVRGELLAGDGERAKELFALGVTGPRA
jgi:carbon storage regulator CsrA